MSTIYRIKILKKSVVLAAAVAAMTFGPAPTEAAVVTFQTAAGSELSHLPVNARADITTEAGRITIVLTNLQADPTSVIQAISDFRFTVANGNTNSSTLTSGTGQALTVNSDGTFSTGGTVDADWVYTHPTQTTGYLDKLSFPGQKSHLILGAPNSVTGKYTDGGGGSILGNGPHNPFLNQTATFIIDAPNVLASTTITFAEFSFGTTGGDDVRGEIITSVPETGSLVMGGLVSLMSLGFAWRKRKLAAV